MDMRLFLALALAATVAASGTSKYTKNWRTFYAYSIPAAGEYEIQLFGKSCKNPFLNMVVLKGAAATVSEDLEESAEYYLAPQYPPLPLASPWNAGLTTINAQSASANPSLTGNGPLRQIQQSVSATEPKVTLVALTSDSDTAKKVEKLSIQFDNTKFETCTNTVSTSGSASDGHNHRRGDAERRSTGHSANAFPIVFDFPAGTYPQTWYFFSDADLVGSHEMTIWPEGNSAGVITHSSKEIIADPNVCSTATTTSTCNCDSEKYMWAGIVLVAGLIGTFPVIFKQCADNQNLLSTMSLFNCFGGGALLSVAVGHVLPEALDLYPASKSDDYPAAAMLCAVGYWLLMIIDKLLLSLCEPKQPADKCDQADDDVENNPAQEASDGSGKGMSKTIISLDLGSTSAQPTGHGSGWDDQSGKQPHVLGATTLQALGVFIAMALHSAMEGISLGIKTDKSSMENLGIAIICHKTFDAMAFGIVLVRADLPTWKALPFVLLVALMTPIGCIAGINSGTISNDINGALQALAAGTFLYVAIQEILAHEFESNKNMVLKCLAVTLGIGMIGIASVSHTRGGHTH